MGLKLIAVSGMITKERLLEILDKSKPEDKLSFYTEIALSSLIIMNLIAVSLESVPSLSKKYDKVIIDTAGRLHTSKNLMLELSKIHKVVSKLTDSVNVLIVLDANTGQNGINQVKEFQRFIDIDGIILTKLDGTAKGGIVVNIMHSLGIPVRYIGVGEGADDLVPFDINEYLLSILGLNNNEK